jgi:hypothetical protein
MRLWEENREGPSPINELSLALEAIRILGTAGNDGSLSLLTPPFNHKMK